MPFLLLLGGARSGKSALAVDIAKRQPGVTVIATGQARDTEMAERIRRHRLERPAGWATIEEPLALAEAVNSAAGQHLLLIDCLTLWVSNAMEAGFSDDQIGETAAAVAGSLATRPAAAIVVSNEVGLGVIPINPLARRYRDALGRVNAAFGARAERSALVLAGRVHELRSAADFMEEIQWLGH